MANARTQHPNAVLTPRHRRRMVGCVLEAGWTIEMTAERFQVDAKTVRKWRDRFIAEGDAGLFDRSKHNSVGIFADGLVLAGLDDSDDFKSRISSAQAHANAFA